MEITRRNLVGGMVGGAAACGVAVAGTAARAAKADEAAGDWDMQADVLVIGEGMGGLCAAMTALQAGVENVTIVEVSKWPGGGSSFSVGSIHASSAGITAESLYNWTGGLSNAPMSVAAVEQIPDLQLWLHDELDLPVGITEAGSKTAAEALSTFSADAPRGHMLDAEGEQGMRGCINFFTEFETLFVDEGGTVLHGVSARHIVRDARGAIAGVQCVDTATGDTLMIASGQVVLACGGFQNDTELKQRYLGIDAHLAGVMGTPYNTGSGIKMAQEVGASLQGDMSHFAGQYLCAAPAKNWMEDVESYETHGYDEDEESKWWLFSTVIDNYPAKGILVNCDGVRFVDEDAPGHSSEPAIARQKRATAIVIADSTAWEEWLALGCRGTVSTMREKVELVCSEKVGGAVYTADTLEGLADAMNASGITTHQVNKANLLATVAEYNAAAEAGTGADLPQARVTRECAPIVAPPFYALPIRNGIFVTFGGVAVNERAQVLDCNRQPIRGLYAASPCAGGFMNEFYCGSIAHAGVTGRWAGASAAEALANA